MPFQTRRISLFIEEKNEWKNVLQFKLTCLNCGCVYWAQKSNSTTCCGSCRELYYMKRKKIANQ